MARWKVYKHCGGGLKPWYVDRAPHVLFDPPQDERNALDFGCHRTHAEAIAAADRGAYLDLIAEG